MEIGSSAVAIMEAERNEKELTRKRFGLLLLSCLMLTAGAISGPLLLKFYFFYGGRRKWLNTWLQTIGFPILVIPLFFFFLIRARKSHHSMKLSSFVLPPSLIGLCVIVGFLTGLCNYLFDVGLSSLPVSTVVILMSTQLAFTAIFAFLIVKQRFTFYSINCIVLLILGSVVIGLHKSRDESGVRVINGDYLLGFFMTVAAAILSGLILPLIEFAYSKARRVINFNTVVQVQIIISITATLVSTIAMAINRDFQAISREAHTFDLGVKKYYVILLCAAISQQLFSLEFHPEKCMALVLCFWGFASYFYGEYKKNQSYRVTKDDSARELDQSVA